MSSKFDELRQKKNARIKAENMELRRELNSRNNELKKTVADSSAKIGKLNAKIVELEKYKSAINKLDSDMDQCDKKLPEGGSDISDREINVFLKYKKKTLEIFNHAARKSDSIGLVPLGPRTSMIEHLAQLCDKALIAEECTLEANQEEIFCWHYYGRNFVFQLKALCDKVKR
ncbi:11716_t:CDS:2, partial [Dentiscutata erythropus]